jgi:hypothetical protein
MDMSSYVPPPHVGYDYSVPETLTLRSATMKLMPLVAVGLCASLLTGCLAPRTAKLKNMAVEYVEAKYGFTAKATDVTVDGISWLEPGWNKGK